MSSRHDALAAGPLGLAEIAWSADRRAGWSAPARPILWLCAIVAGLILAKLAVYVAAAQSYGGAELGLCRWDCEWYLHTMTNGYDPVPRMRPYHNFANWAFFPLFPVLGQIFQAVSGATAFWSGTIVSLLCFGAFAVLSCHYRRLTRGPGVQNLPWLVLLTVYPFSLYFLMPYSESTYLLTTVLLLLAVQARHAVGAGLSAALLSATRPTGVLAIPYLVVDRALHARRTLRRDMTWGERLKLLADCGLPLALAPLGIASYMAYLYWLTGDALAFSHVQVAWDRVFINPMKTFYWAIAKNDWHLMLNPDIPAPRSYSASFAVVAGMASLWLLSRRHVLEAWLLGSVVVLALMTSETSVPRYVTANPIFLLVLGDVMDRIRKRAVLIGLALVALALQAFLLNTWFIESSLLM
ncbi:hypothetical protein ACLF3G_28460 [Falsiroseomonas sp. HC035]|uniref:hypothetical protein n=1 Tax=Falsiroseomonas sp. HC035 TaxID=3390999 RepID=UPI003D3190AC